VIRVIGGRWRGRKLLVPPGSTTRPTSERARQALFDMLLHAPFAGRAQVEGARVLDAFAGSGALGIEALSRGAAEAAFIENDPAALRALRANVAALGEGVGARVIAADATDPPAPPVAATLAFLDAPYGQCLAARALIALAARGWFAEGALVCVETARGEALACGPGFAVLDDRSHGRARLRTLGFGAAPPDAARLSAGSAASR
jgi:16S rRNA (guanine966-N2)-methyltransferase